MAGPGPRLCAQAHDSADYSEDACAAACTNPIDVIKTRMQTHLRGSPRYADYSSYWATGRCIVRQEGWAALFNGALIRCALRVPLGLSVIMVSSHAMRGAALARTDCAPSLACLLCAAIDHDVDGIDDGDGHPLTWGRVAHAHAWLVQHASCAAQAGGYSSDDEEAPAGCPCTWHPVAIEERASHLLVCRAWPGPLCGSCWAASCECGYAFDAVADAHSRWPNGRLRCHSCAS